MIQNNKLKVGEMETKTFNKVLQDMKRFVRNDYKVVFAPMGLGEPLMNNKWKEIFKKVKKTSRSIYFILVTNGVLLDKKTSEELVKLGIDEISLSLNVNNDRDYKKYINEGGNYLKVKENIKNLIEIRNKNKKSKMKIFIQYLDYDEKPDKFLNDITEWEKIMRPQDKCYVHPIVNQAGFKKEGVTIRKKETFPCFSPLNRVAIKLNGDMYPCDPCFYGGTTKIKELRLGNIRNTSFFGLIKDKKSKVYKIIKSMKNEEYDQLPTCKECNTYKLSGNLFFSLPFGLKFFKQKWF
jgi:radical SAM protein with 4Fe4S-binding SPASM domain